MPAITVRPLIENERPAYYRLAVVVFGGAEDPEPRVQRWSRAIERHPNFDPIQVRGAFRDEQFLGGYIDYERTLAIGPARLLTGCIGAVVTHPDHRLQGAASALLADAIRLAEERGHALLLLDGIPNFYHRFGFTGVLAVGSYTIQLADILAPSTALRADLPTSSHRIRPAREADAGDLLRLYHQEFDPFPGAFARTLAIQQHQLAGRLAANPPLLAIDADDRVTGYILPPWTQTDPNSYEIVAPHWDIASALLQHHARALAAADPAATTLTWQIPPGSATFFALADHIHLENSARHLPSGDWMARIGHLPAFLNAILPAWSERWQRNNLLWSGPIRFQCGDASFCLNFDGYQVLLHDRAPSSAPTIRLTPQALVQLTFGSRPAWWLALQPGNDISDHLIDVLQALAPTHPGWIPGSDRF